MRGSYLHSTDGAGGCRGGVGSGDGDWELEVGSQCQASPEMMALCTLIDEVRELLENNAGHLGKMVLRKWLDEAKRLRDEEYKSKKPF